LEAIIIGAYFFLPLFISLIRKLSGNAFLTIFLISLAGPASFLFLVLASSGGGSDELYYFTLGLPTTLAIFWPSVGISSGNKIINNDIDVNASILSAIAEWKRGDVIDQTCPKCNSTLRIESITSDVNVGKMRLLVSCNCSVCNKTMY
jgi:hypothetical protein